GEARAEFRDNLKSLREHLEHIKALIRREQANAREALLLETTHLSLLMDEAVLIVSAPEGWSGKEIIRDYEDLAPVQTDHHLVLSILINLVTNARHALAAKPPGNRRLIVRVLSMEDDRVALEVTDNGIGIATEDLRRIFRHGFTTREG